MTSAPRLRLRIHVSTCSVALIIALMSTSSGCLLDNPAFDGPDTLAGDSGDSFGDGDGDPSGDGDGDPGMTSSTGDGDGGPTTGDGDGDATTGDGDGDGDGTTGDGDGDGDGTTGDGDGDPNTGDGDGDPDLEMCAIEIPLDSYVPLLTESLSYLDPSSAPGFDLAPTNCHLAMICRAEQPECNPNTVYMGKVYSSGQTHVGDGAALPSSLQLRFHPGGGECFGSTLSLNPNQKIGVDIWNGQSFDTVWVRMPCLKEYNVPIYIAQDGSTFWDIGLTDAASLW